MDGENSPETDWPPCGLARLRPEERTLWDEQFLEPPPPDSDEGPGITVWGLGQWCILEPYGVPKVVAEHKSKTGSAEPIARYQENRRQARG